MNTLREQFPLRFGSHPTRQDGMCAMEMVAWLAGEEHSDDPRCVCPVLAAYVRSVNDNLPSDAARDQYLRPLVPLFIGTRGAKHVERQRAQLILRHANEVLAPMIADAGNRRVPRELIWMRSMAAQRVEPRGWVQAAGRLARRAGPDAWESVADLLRKLAQLSPEQRTPLQSVSL